MSVDHGTSPREKLGLSIIRHQAGILLENSFIKGSVEDEKLAAVAVDESESDLDGNVDSPAASAVAANTHLFRCRAELAKTYCEIC